MAWRRLIRTTAFVLVATAGSGFAAASDGPGDEGQSLREALQALQRQGLGLVYSNALIRPDQRVTQPADPASSPAEQAAALLAPFGLTLQRSGGGLYYVVRKPAAPAQTVDPPAPGQADVTSPIEELVVTSSRYRLVRDSHGTQTLGQRELQIIPSLGRDVLRAVNYLPGQASLGVSARNHMRGGNTDEVLYLVDGLEVIEPFHMGDFHALFSAINPALVDNVTVYHAGFPATFGSRLSGVVDISLVEPQQSWQGAISADSISGAAHAGGYAGNFSWLASARRSTVDQVLRLLENDFGEPSFQDQLLRLSWDDGVTALSGGALFGNDELSLEDNGAGETAGSDFHSTQAWLRGTRDLGARLQLDAALSYSAIDNERRGRLDDPFDAVGALEEEREFSEWAVRTGVRWQPAPAWSVDVGIEGRFQEADYVVAMDALYGELADPLQAAPSLHRAVDAERDGTLFTGYLSARQQFAGGLRLEYGFRYDLQDIDPVHDVQFSPRLQLTFERPRWQTFLNIGRYTQHQSLYELQVDDGLLELQEPQVSDQLSAGIDWLATDRLHVRLESYWRRVRDPRARFENIYNRWVLLPELHADRLRVDPSRVHTYGGEVGFEYQYDDGFRAFLSLAAAHAREQLDGDWRSRPWQQHRTLRAGVDWRPGAWQVGVVATWHGGWPTTSRQEAPLATTAQLYDRSLPDYFSLDLHLARTVALPQGDLEIYFDLSNATLEDHVGGYRYEPAPEGIRADERMLLPGVPVLGIEWRW